MKRKNGAEKGKRKSGMKWKSSETKWNIVRLRNREIKQINNKLNSINNLKTVMIMKKEMYVAPELEVLEVMVEAGFVVSGMDEEKQEW